MNNLINARIAEVIDNQTVAISAGSDEGVEIGMHFKIFSETKVEIKDPITNDLLGELDIEKLRVEVTKVYDKFCLAETYEHETVNEGGFYSSGLGSLNKMFEEPRLVKRRKTFELDKDGKRPIDKAESIVRVGDRVEQVIAKKPIVK